MSVYDYLENPDSWKPTAYTRTIQNPAKSLIHFWMPKTIEQRLYIKVQAEGPSDDDIETYALWVGRVGSRIILEASDLEYVGP